MTDNEDRNEQRAFRTPLPSAIDSERSALSCVLQCARTRSRAARTLAEEHFHNPANRILYRTICELGEFATPVSVQEKLIQRQQLEAVGPTEVTDMWTLEATAAMFPHYAEQILEAYERRQALLSAERLTEAARDWTADFREVAATELSNAAAIRRRDEGKDLKTRVFEYQDRLERRLAGELKSAIRTRFRKLNKLTGGGLPLGSLFVVGGRESSGKSLFAQNLAEDVMNAGKRALWFSPEMSFDEIMNRHVASMESIPAYVLFDVENNRPTPEQQMRIGERLQAIANADLLEVREDFMTVDAIRLEALDVAARGNLGAIFIDYLQLVLASDQRAIREQQIAHVSRSLRRLAKETGAPVVALSQLNNQNEVRESMAIVQDAGVLVRISYKSDEERKDGNAELFIQKNRHGRSFVSIPLKHELGFFRFTEA